ncbi:MAG TPA: hypothetical protein VK698_07690 [Kofleriaceae bacterium]|nr:hypothetical protein [Kofleriaceae bacterium]
MRFERSGPLSAVMMVLCLGACSGGGGEAAQPTAPAASPPAAAPAGQGGGAGDAERKLRAAQDSAVEALCDRLVDCAVESARASMSPEEVAKLDVEETAPRLRDECEADGAKSSLSPRQVRVVQRCVTEAGTCDELQACVQEAKKKE